MSVPATAPVVVPDRCDRRAVAWMVVGAVAFSVFPLCLVLASAHEHPLQYNAIFFLIVAVVLLLVAGPRRSLHTCRSWFGHGPTTVAILVTVVLSGVLSADVAVFALALHLATPILANLLYELWPLVAAATTPLLTFVLLRRSPAGPAAIVGRCLHRHARTPWLRLAIAGLCCVGGTYVLLVAVRPGHGLGVGSVSLGAWAGIGLALLAAMMFAAQTWCNRATAALVATVDPGLGVVRRHLFAYGTGKWVLVLGLTPVAFLLGDPITVVGAFWAVVGGLTAVIGGAALRLGQHYAHGHDINLVYYLSPVLATLWLWWVSLPGPEGQPEPSWQLTVLGVHAVLLGVLLLADGVARGWLQRLALVAVAGIGFAAFALAPVWLDRLTLTVAASFLATVHAFVLARTGGVRLLPVFAVGVTYAVYLAVLW